MAGVRDKYLRGPHKDIYYISEEDEKKTLKWFNMARDYDQKLILEACQESNSDLANVLFASLTLDVGYDYLSKRYWIPIARKDFQGYRRKAIYMYYELLRIHRKEDLIGKILNKKT